MEKQITDVTNFKAETKLKLLSQENEYALSNIRYLHFYTHLKT